MEWIGLAKLVLGLAGLSALAWFVWKSRSGEIANADRKRDEAEGRAIAGYEEAEYQRKVAEEERRVSKNVAKIDRDGVDVDRVMRLLNGTADDKGSKTS